MRFLFANCAVKEGFWILTIPIRRTLVQFTTAHARPAPNADIIQILLNWIVSSSYFGLVFECLKCVPPLVAVT